MKTFSMTHIGRRREMNQDYMYTSENAVGKLPNLFLVADGMGGHKAGEYASRFTVEKIVETIETSGQTEPVAAMKEAVEAANRGLLEEAGRDAAKAGMGTTVVGGPGVSPGCHSDRRSSACCQCRGQSFILNKSRSYQADHKGSFSGRRDGPFRRDG